MQLFLKSNAVAGQVLRIHREEINDHDRENSLTFLFNESHLDGKMRLALYIIMKECNSLVVLTMSIS